jgi:hypothetical protein
MKGTRIKVMFVTRSGPVFGAAEMLNPISRTEQPFRFVAFAHDDRSRLQATPGPSSKPEIPIPVQAGREFDTEDGSGPKLACYPEDQWIDQYRDAINRNPPPRRLLKRMLDAIMPGTR